MKKSEERESDNNSKQPKLKAFYKHRKTAYTMNMKDKNNNQPTVRINPLILKTLN